jgi:hypothetical protein
MKKIFILLLTISIWGCGTDQGESRTYDYSVINNSGGTIEIIPYENGIKREDRKRVLVNTQKVNKQITIFPPSGGGFRMITTLFPDFVADRIDIIFAGTKKISHFECSPSNSCNNQPNNIFNDVFSDEQTEVYAITAEDFQNATDCGGPCN